MPTPPMPTVPGMTDTLEFVKNLWGGMNVPGVTTPTLSTDELDKKINDLKAVEAWLNLNLTMLRGTIQGLEVQRGTIATLKSMSDNLAQAMGQAAGEGKAGAPFQAFFTPPAGGAGAPAAQPQQAGQQLPPAAEAMPAAVAWWNVLQDQFKQAVASTLSPEAMANASAMAKEAAARFGETGKPPAAEPAAGESTDNASAQPGVANNKSRGAKPKGR